MAKTAIHALADHLARRDHAENELRRKLIQKFPESEVEAAIATARKQNWLLPPEELSEKVNAQLIAKGKGWLYRRQYLKEKGLPEPFFDQERELECALQVVQKKADSIARAVSAQKKQAALLQNRGFDSETIRKVIYEKQ